MPPLFPYFVLFRPFFSFAFYNLFFFPIILPYIHTFTLLSLSSLSNPILPALFFSTSLGLLPSSLFQDSLVVTCPSLSRRIESGVAMRYFAQVTLNWLTHYMESLNTDDGLYRWAKEAFVLTSDEAQPPQKGSGFEYHAALRIHLETLHALWWASNCLLSTLVSFFSHFLV